MKRDYSSIIAPRANVSASVLCLTSLLIPVVCGIAKAADTATDPVEALLYSTMPSTKQHRAQLAVDSDPKTYFKTVYGMDDGDDFTVWLSRAVPVQSIKVVTGDTDGNDTLTNGYIDVSADGQKYTKLVSFDKDGVASATLPGTLVQSFRIKLDRNRGIPSLLIRDIAVQSTTPISHYVYGPGRGFSDISQAPDLAEWDRKAEAQMEEFWPDLAAMMYSTDFVTPNKVNVVYKTGPGVTDVAATGGGVMTVNSAWCRKNPNDTGLTVHETAHVVQSMSAYNPVWLIEGVADYMRWVKFEPENYTVRINPKTATYHDSYRTTGTFLGWLEINYDKTLVTQLNDDVRFGNFNIGLFKKYCGKDVDTLWAEFIAAYQKDPANIITPPVAQADRPRNLPVMKAGTSVSADLSKIFTDTGITADGATFGANTGFDGGGASFSSTLLGAGVDNQNVHFTIGKAGGANIVSAAGQKVSVTPGKYASLWVLGSAVEGSQKVQTFTVNYSDGSKTDLIQNMSDWFQPQNFPGETRAVKMDYRNMADGSKDPRTFYAFSYGFALDATKELSSITLPDNPNVKILAISVAN